MGQNAPLSVESLTFCYEDESGRSLMVLTPQGGQPPYTFLFADGTTTTAPVYQRVMMHRHIFPYLVRDAAGATFQQVYKNECTGAPPDLLPRITLSSPLTSGNFAPLHQQISMPIYAEHFDNIKEARFSIDIWDFSKLDSISWRPELGITPLQYIFDGSRLHVYWSAPVALTLDADQPLATLWFTPRDATPHFWASFALSQIMTPQYQQLLTTPGAVHRNFNALLGEPVWVRADSVTAAGYGETCVPIVAEQIAPLQGFQLGLAFDTTQFRHTRNILHPNLPDPLGEFYHALPPYVLTSWVGGNLEFAPLAAGDTLFFACFEPLHPSAASAIVQAPPYIGNGFPGEAIIANDIIVPMTLRSGGLSLAPDMAVYPGDADANGIVNHYDLLPMGLAAGNADARRGPRPVPDGEWAPQPAMSWGASTPASLINMAHTDADGDGALTAADTDLLAAHYSLQNEHWGGNLMAHPILPDPVGGAPGPLLYVETAPLEVGAASASFYVVLGEGQAPAADAYGLAFSIYYDPQWVEPGSMSAHFQESWLGNAAAGAWVFACDHPELGRIDIAITRTDGEAAIGAGPVARLAWTPRLPAVGTPPGMVFRPDDVVYLNAAEQRLPLTPLSTQAPVTGGEITASSWMETARQRLRVYPNPAHNRVTVAAEGLRIEALSCHTATGEQVRYAAGADGGLSLEGLPAGLYWIRAYGPEGWVSRPIVKE